ncbi:hypothetical protein [Miltoncostaea oceani]|uniref:hypothetical protein n=1 Tax=Miltoncostaea oceani TaxID=2843216 RepID=UPI001C3D7F76|nr:hypothetical protein [Miltoncostaea oceani]
MSEKVTTGPDGSVFVSGYGRKPRVRTPDGRALKNGLIVAYRMPDGQVLIGQIAALTQTTGTIELRLWSPGAPVISDGIATLESIQVTCLASEVHIVEPQQGRAL